ncbi:MAG TPA: type II secretion system protein N, partial [Rhodanobacteraceae bacterium]
YLGPVVLSGVRGTLWNGHADGISVFGRDLGEIDWRIAKTALLRGHVAADVRVQGTDVDAAGLVERDEPGALTLRDIRFRFPAHLLEPALDEPDVSLLGVISGAVSEASLRDGFLQSATGNARWSEAGVNAGTETRFADILADFAAQPNGGLAGTAHDDGTGNLAVTAKFRAGIDGFEVDSVLRARNGDPQVEDTLRYVGNPQADGSSKLVVRGRLFKLY